MRKQSPEYVVGRAIELRERQTAAEELLWQYLRSRKLDGYKFYRQHPLGKFIVDFYCPEKKLVIELDGEIHDARLEYDLTRDGKLLALGVRVYRIKNELVFSDINATLHEIRYQLSN